jgi:hypothetical protein
MALAPIVLFAYNRSLHTKQTVEKLLEADLASASDLIIFSDGPRSEKDQDSVNETRKYLASISGFKSLKIHEAEKNMGLASSVINGVSEVIAEYGKVIVFEDDLLVSPQTLTYMNHYLDLYEKEEKVISIHSFVYPLKKYSGKPFFIRGADCYGWATWKRGWDLFEKDATKLYDQITSNRDLAYQFDFEGSYPYTKMLKRQIEGKVDSWAIRWYASAFLLGKVTLYPPSSLIQNIGMDGSGTHSDDMDLFTHTTLNEKLENLLIAPRSIEEDRDMFLKFKAFFRSMKPSIVKRLINKLKK